MIGASRGIGLGLVQRLLERRWQVIATHRGRSSELAALAERYSTLRLAAFDLAYPEQLDAVLACVGEPGLDRLIVNGAAIGPAHQRAERMTRDETAELFDINALAPIRCARRALPYMIRGADEPTDTRRGQIVFISSVMGSVAENERGDYELYRASKAALNSLTRSFAAKDALPAGVGVQSLHPGWVATDLGGYDAPLGVADSTVGLADRITLDALGLEQRFVDYAGAPLAW